MGWKWDQGTLVEEFAKGRPVPEAGMAKKVKPEESRPVIVHQIFVTFQYADSKE